MSGRDIGIVYTGLREGEKMHEELVGDGESDNRPVHPKISHTTVPALHPSQLDDVHSDMGPWTAELARPVPSESPAQVEDPA
jgi:FlaA1/EpsC-like NDP-sugar epimerase